MLDQHGPALHRYVRASVGPAEAEDCFQDTVCAALRSYGRSTPSGADLRAWLFTIAHGVVVDHHRRREQRSKPRPRPADRTEQAVEPADESVWEALDALPPKQRAAVLLRIVDDLAYGEVATIMATSEAAARRNVHVALGRLRKELAHVR